jgi:3-isopropylmalate dehydrogenase
MNLNIAVLAGDGIGPEVVAQAQKVCDAIAKKYNHQINWTPAITGAAAIDAVGEPYPDSTHEICMNSDAVLFGAIGLPRFDNDPSNPVRPEQGLLAMRKKLGLYANIRPTLVFPSLLHKSPLRPELIENADFVCIRELTGGIYFGDKGRNEARDRAWDVCEYTKPEVERIIRLAYTYAMARKKKLTIVDKANVLETSRLWREVGQSLEKEYPEVTTEYLLVDAAAMRIIQWPEGFDVMVTENMFGDILTDEASVISGSMGLMPSASIGLHTSVFEPIHGSYPQATGLNIANPIGTVLSAAMMFEYAFKLMDEAQEIKDVVNKSLEEGIVTEDIARKDKAYGTSEVGDWLAAQIV